MARHVVKLAATATPSYRWNRILYPCAQNQLNRCDRYCPSFFSFCSPHVQTAGFLHSAGKAPPVPPSPAASETFQVCTSKKISQKTTKGAVASTRAKRKQSKAKNHINRKRDINPRYGASPKAAELVDLISAASIEKDVAVELDKWVNNKCVFPIAYVKQALLILEKEEKWEQIIQICSWMLRKGHGKTVGTYEALLHAYDVLRKDEEAEAIWENSILRGSSSVPARAFCYALAMYERHNKPQQIIKLFVHMEQNGMRKLDDESVKRVARAFEKEGFLERGRQVLRQHQLPLEDGSDSDVKQQ